MSELHPFLLKTNVGCDLLSTKYVSINAEGGTKIKHMLMGLNDVYYTTGHVANIMLQPCDRGCQLLGLDHYACGGKNVLRSHLALGIITS